MGKLTDILIATIGMYEILLSRENQPTLIDRTIEKGARLYHAGLGMYRIIIPEPEREPMRPAEPKVNVRDADYYRKKMDDISTRLNT